MIKITATKTKLNASLAIGGAVACFVPIVFNIVNGRPVSTNDFVSVLGCIAALFAGNIDRTNTGTAAVFRALKRDATKTGNGE